MSRIAHHPHGQIYAYPFIPPQNGQSRSGGYRSRTRRWLWRGPRRRLEDGRRIVAETDNFVALCASAARWPYEIHIQPRKHVADLADLTRRRTRRTAPRLRPMSLRRSMVYSGNPCPIYQPCFRLGFMRWHLAHLRIEIVSPRRAPGKAEIPGQDESPLARSSTTGTGASRCPISALVPDRSRECMSRKVVLNRVRTGE